MRTISIIISILFYTLALTIISSITPSAQADSSKWETSISKDEMTGKIQAFAFSPSIGPTKTMNWPYNNVKAWLGVGCDNKTEWAYIGFTQAPNLSSKVTNDGYNTFETRIKWDDTIENEILNQGWGESFVHFECDEYAIEQIESSNSVLVEIPWHGNGKVYFKFPLNGSSAAIKTIRDLVKK